MFFDLTIAYQTICKKINFVVSLTLSRKIFSYHGNNGSDELVSKENSITSYLHKYFTPNRKWYKDVVIKKNSMCITLFRYT